jgi:hypoxanthine phosphoribosyltransferase
VASAPDRTGQLGGRSLRRIVYTEKEIQERVSALAREISAAYDASDDLLVLGLLKGSFIFLADLVRRIDRPLQVDFLVASSYGAGTVSSGAVRLLYDPEADLAGRAGGLVVDSVDSGATLNRVVARLAARGPRSLELCALLHKRRVRLELEPRWVGFDAPGEFLVGYGLDYSEDLRHLPYIASL